MNLVAVERTVSGDRAEYDKNPTGPTGDQAISVSGKIDNGEILNLHVEPLKLLVIVSVIIH